MDGHHKVENQQLFPYFKPLIPDVPYLQLMKEHKVVDSSLKEINSGLNSLRSKRDVISSLKKLQSGFKKINQIWHPHIQIEETQLFQKVGSLDINRDEMIRIQKKFSDFFQKKAGPAYLLVPFALYNSSPEDRAILAQGFPETVTQQLVPIDWKDKWTSMQPFFLK